VSISDRNWVSVDYTRCIMYMHSWMVLFMPYEGVGGNVLWGVKSIALNLAAKPSCHLLATPLM
jgi:hypothetical protein